jgi:uncharacterized protein YxjI
VIIGNQVYSSPVALRGKIQEAAGTVAQTQGMVDYVEIMADGYLALDNTATDENRKKNQVTFIEEGLYIHAERDKKGDLKSFEMIDERGEQTQEIKKTMNDGRASYEISMGGQKAMISEDSNGTLVFDVAQ